MIMTQLTDVIPGPPLGGTRNPWRGMGLAREVDPGFAAKCGAPG